MLFALRFGRGERENQTQVRMSIDRPFRVCAEGQDEVLKIGVAGVRKRERAARRRRVLLAFDGRVDDRVHELRILDAPLQRGAQKLWDRFDNRSGAEVKIDVLAIEEVGQRQRGDHSI